MCYKGEVNLKSSTYASIATIVFLKNKEKVCRSIESAIRATDIYCDKLGLKNNLSHMTKYRAINNLIDSNIIDNIDTEKNIRLRLSDRIFKIVKF